MLVCQFSLDELAVQTCDIGDGLILRALSLAGTGVGAVTEAELLHLGDHVLDTASSLDAALRQQCELADLTGYKEHSRTILAGCHTSASTDAGSAVHSLVGCLLGDQDGIGILGLAGAHGGVAAGSDNLIEGGTIHHTVLDDGESC